MNTEDSEFERIEREIKTRALPDPIHHTDTRESLEYITGWNDCRQAMLAEQPEHHDPIGDAQDKLIAEQAAMPAPVQQKFVGWGAISPTTGRFYGVVFNADEIQGDSKKHLIPLFSPQAQQAQQEPVACMQNRIELYVEDYPSEHFPIPLYTSPQAQRKPLTDEQIFNACAPLGFAQLSVIEVARAIEAAHNIRENT